MHLLHFGTYEQLLYPYVKHSLKAEDRVQNETAFVQHLLLSADENGEIVSDITPSAASRYRSGARVIPENVVALFRKAKAREMVVEYLDDLVVPYIERGRKKQLIKEFSDLIAQDTTIDREFKADLLEESAPECLAAFLADLLIYAVGIDPTERDKEYPVENYNLPMSNDWFTGRSKELEAITNNFADGQRMQILYGMGGMGKSQIARKFVYDHYRSYSLIHWINAHSIESVVECYKAFLKEKQIAPADQTKEAICQSYTKFMDSHSDWLLVYDNCDYYTDKEYDDFFALCLPKNRKVGNILITARNKRSIGKAKKVQVNTFADEDAVAFLLQRTESDDAAGAERLVERLGRYPLALEIAGAYIHATPGSTFQTYLSYLAQETKILDQMAEMTDYHETIRDILTLTIRRHKEDRNSDIISLCVEDALHLLAYGAPYNIKLGAMAFLPLCEYSHADILGRSAQSDNHLQALKEICSDRLKCDELARTLVTYGLAGEQPDGLLFIHAVQQEVVRDYIYPESDWSQLLYIALSDFADSDNARWLYFYQHEVYIAKHWEELAQRVVVPDSAAAFFRLQHLKAQVSLSVERFKARIAESSEISKKEFRDNDLAIRQAVKEMAGVYETLDEELILIDDLGDYIVRLTDVLAFYRIMRLYAPVAGFILYALHALFRAFNRWGEDAVISDSLRYGDVRDPEKGYLGMLLLEIRRCLPLAQLAGESCNEYLAVYLGQLSKWLSIYAVIAGWRKKELADYLMIIDAYIKCDVNRLPQSVAGKSE